VRVLVVLTIWIIFPVYYTILASVTSYITNGFCLVWSLWRSYAAKQIMMISSVFLTYLLPLALMIFCYSRVVCTLRTKVTKIALTHHARCNSTVLYVPLCD